jgi:hypothetical protein
MERLIKHYSCFFDESHHQEKLFPNLHYCFHQFTILIHNFIPFTKGSTSTNRIKVSVGFFFCFFNPQNIT